MVFALGHDALTLSIGRALIGLGVSVALMSGFKANVLYWPIGRLPLVNAVMMTFGGLGAAMATRPVQWLLADHDWRHVFFGLGAPHRGRRGLPDRRPRRVMRGPAADGSAAKCAASST